MTKKHCHGGTCETNHNTSLAGQVNNYMYLSDLTPPNRSITPIKHRDLGVKPEKTKA